MKIPNLPPRFDELIRNSEAPVLVDFSAEWCGPCKTAEPTIKRLAQELKGRLVVVKIDVDKKPGIASQYQVRSVPTFVMFHRGKVLWRVSGAMPFNMMYNEIMKRMPR